MRKPIKLLYADKHLKLSNYDLVKDITEQEIKLAKKLNVDIVGLGDELVSRQAQPLFVLEGFGKLHQMYINAGINRVCIVGNHCKVNYTSESNYLDEFKYHPNMKIVDTVHYEDIEGLRLHYVAYFDEKVNYKDYLQRAIENIDKSKYNVLLTHVLFNGGINNDGGEFSGSKLNLEDFKDFDKVLSGHIHDRAHHKNFYYIGACYANNFGEDNEKGFTILYDDGSHELVNSEFPEYHTIKIDLDKVTKEELNELKKDGATLIKDSGANIRFKFEGSEDKVKAIKSEEFTTFGIDIKKEHKTIVRSIEKAETGEVVTYDDETILKKFETFCEEEKYDNVEYGRRCLTQKLKENG